MADKRRPAPTKQAAGKPRQSARPGPASTPPKSVPPRQARPPQRPAEPSRRPPQRTQQRPAQQPEDNRQFRSAGAGSVPSWAREADAIFKEETSGTWYSPRQGDNTFRMLAGRDANGQFTAAPFKRYLKHREVGPKGRQILCGHDIRGGGQCWLCDVKIPELRRSQNPAAIARADALIPQVQLGVLVAYMENGQWLGPKLWETRLAGPRSKGVQLMAYLRNMQRNFTSLSKGYNINMTRTGTGKTGTDYGPMIPDNHPSAVPKEIVSKIRPLAEVVGVYSQQKQEEAYYGRDRSDDGGRKGGRGAQSRQSQRYEQPVDDIGGNADEVYGGDPREEEFQEGEEFVEDGQGEFVEGEQEGGEFVDGASEDGEEEFQEGAGDYQEGQDEEFQESEEFAQGVNGDENFDDVLGGIPDGPSARRAYDSPANPPGRSRGFQDPPPQNPPRRQQPRQPQGRRTRSA